MCNMQALACDVTKTRWGGSGSRLSSSFQMFKIDMHTWLVHHVDPYTYWIRTSLNTGCTRLAQHFEHRTTPSSLSHTPVANQWSMGHKSLNLHVVYFWSGLTYHINQLKLIVHFELEHQIFMSKFSTGTSSFLESVCVRHTSTSD